MKKELGFVAGAVLCLACCAFAGCGGTSGACDSEVNYIFNLCDKNQDGLVSAEEADIFAAQQEAMLKSNGRLKFNSETRELEIADKLANDPEAYAAFQKNVAMKNAAEAAQKAAEAASAAQKAPAGKESAE